MKLTFLVKNSRDSKELAASQPYSHVKLFYPQILSGYQLQNKQIPTRKFGDTSWM